MNAKNVIYIVLNHRWNVQTAIIRGEKTNNSMEKRCMEKFRVFFSSFYFLITLLRSTLSLRSVSALVLKPIEFSESEKKRPTRTTLTHTYYNDFSIHILII